MHDETPLIALIAIGMLFDPMILARQPLQVLMVLAITGLGRLLGRSANAVKKVTPAV